MLVYNLGTKVLVYRGKNIPPHGGYLDFSDLTFVPARDRTNKLLAFGSLPSGWKPQVIILPPPPPVLTPVAPAAPEMLAVQVVEEVPVVEVPPEAKAEPPPQPKEGWSKKKRF